MQGLLLLSALFLAGLFLLGAECTVENAVIPYRLEDCDDKVDNDSDGYVDSLDRDCALAAPGADSLSFDFSAARNPDTVLRQDTGSLFNSPYTVKGVTRGAQRVSVRVLAEDAGGLSPSQRDTLYSLSLVSGAGGAFEQGVRLRARSNLLVGFGIRGTSVTPAETLRVILKDRP